jgi:surfeit locus 1 family protein
MTLWGTRRSILAILVGVAMTILGLSLGNWQTRRGDIKESLEAQWDAAERAVPFSIRRREDVQAVADRVPLRVVIRGEFLPAATVFVDNRMLDAAAGFQVVTPMRLEGGATVLVNRGWVARDATDPIRIPDLTTPHGLTLVEGMAVARVPRLLELAPAEPAALPGIWPNLEFNEYERVAGLQVPRFVVQQTSDGSDGLRRAWVRPAAGVEKHRGYALQWYGLAALSAALTLYFGGRVLRRSSR